MPMSLRKRLADQKEDVLRYCKVYGRYRAMDKFNVSDTLAFGRLLEEWTGNDKFGFSPEIRLETDESVGDRLVEAILRKISNLEDENRQLKERNEYLITQINLTQRKNKVADDIEKILKACGT